MRRWSRVRTLCTLEISTPCTTSRGFYEQISERLFTLLLGGGGDSRYIKPYPSCDARHFLSRSRSNVNA